MGEEWESVLGMEESEKRCGKVCRDVGKVRGDVGRGVGCREVCWGVVVEKCWERCGKMSWDVGEVKKDVGKCGGGMGNPNAPLTTLLHNPHISPNTSPTPQHTSPHSPHLSPHLPLPFP